MAAVALVGAGLMGTGLARLFTRAGWPVAAWDRDAAAIARLGDQVPTARLAGDLGDALAGAALVIEAVAERPEVKQAVFAEIVAHAAPGAILATNSSVIPVGVVATELSDADAAVVVGMHFWNPPDLIPLVEVIPGPRTAPDTVSRAMAFLTEIGKEPVAVRRDVVPGNRLQHALWREAMALVDEGICAPEDVDRIVRRGFGARLAVLGPLENADLIGLELTRDIHTVILPTLSQAVEPAAGLTGRLADGRSGAAAGAGFLDWPSGRLGATRARLAKHLRSAFA